MYPILYYGFKLLKINFEKKIRFPIWQLFVVVQIAVEKKTIKKFYFLFLKPPIERKWIEKKTNSKNLNHNLHIKHNLKAIFHCQFLLTFICCKLSKNQKKKKTFICWSKYLYLPLSILRPNFLQRESPSGQRKW